MSDGQHVDELWQRAHDLDELFERSAGIATCTAGEICREDNSPAALQSLVTTTCAKAQDAVEGVTGLQPEVEDLVKAVAADCSQYDQLVQALGGPNPSSSAWQDSATQLHRDLAAKLDASRSSLPETQPGQVEPDTTGNHWGGGSGSDSAGTHTQNPSHVWVSVGSPINPLNVSSGGRYHDRCYDYTGDGYDDACQAADGGDWANDLAGTGQVNLYLDSAGWAAGYTYPPDLTKPVEIYAYASFQGNWDTNGGDAGGCYYRRYEVYVEFHDTSGQYHVDQIGRVTIGHATNWQQSLQTYIYPNASKASGGGSTISYINGIHIADVYTGSDFGTCATGAHNHVEGLSYHDYGAQYEWRSQYGPDFFNYPFNHVHGTGGAYSGFYPYDDTSYGTTIAFLGGGTYSPAMWDNPNYGDH